MSEPRYLHSREQRRRIKDTIFESMFWTGIFWVVGLYAVWNGNGFGWLPLIVGLLFWGVFLWQLFHLDHVRPYDYDEEES